MSRLPHRIYKGLRALAEGVSTVDSFLNSVGRYLPKSAPSLGRAVNGSRMDSGEDVGANLRRYASRILFDLREQGFAVEKGDGIFLTKRGREKLKNLISRFKKELPQKEYKTEQSKDLVIVSFDIPERDRYKRDWLRDVLHNLSLKLYHQSLWMGNIVVPEELIRDLVHQRLDRNVAIFTVGKQGTIRKIV